MNKKIIQIAGSKGKGTTAHLLAQILILAGKRVGLFTSPAILDDREMIQVNGEMISEENYEELMKKHEGSVFERQTLSAFEYFESEGCDVWILECGWESPSDATCWAPQQDLFLLAHVEVEHKEILGESLEEIESTQLSIRREASPMIRMDEVASRVCGRHHPSCVGLAISAAEHLGVKMNGEMMKALASLVIPGRFELIEIAGHKVILDGAHTPDSVDYVLKEAQSFAAESPLPLRFGIHFLSDKDEDLWKKFPRLESFWVKIEHERAGKEPDALVSVSVQELLNQIQNSPEQCIWAVIGSFKLVAEFKRFMTS